MKRRRIAAATAVAALGALTLAACGSSSPGSSTNAAAAKCAATIGMEGPLTGPVAPLGQEQLHFAELAVAMDNTANKTHIALAQGDTQLQPSQATTVTQQFISNNSIAGV